MSATLARRQAWMFDAITSDTAPPRIDRILGGAAVSADIGLEVYRHAFRARLRDCLADDFSAVQQLVGEASFAVMADAYVSEIPPSASTLNRYGSQFPAWLRAAAARLNSRLQLRLVQRTHLIELAHLEWALVESIHAASATTITRSALAKLPPGGWAEIRLTPVPSLRLVRCTWSINATYAAFLTGRIARTTPQRQSGAVVVLRRPAGLRRHELNAIEARLLTKLCAGASLGTALAGIAPEHAATVQAACARWLASGFFSGLQ